MVSHPKEEVGRHRRYQAQGPQEAVGMHYPLEVVAGVLLGVAIFSLGLLVLESDKVHHSKRLASLLEKILKASHLPQVL
jgi:hypothetical protein